MRMPFRQMIDLGRYMSRKKRAGEKYFPLVLMLEPLHACNLACIGCGRIVEYKETIRDQMPLEDALGAAALDAVVCEPVFASAITIPHPRAQKPGRVHVHVARCRSVRSPDAQCGADDCY